MPKATVNQDTIRHDLNTCPGGFVDLRTLSFHEMQMRQDLAARMYQEQQVGGKKKPGNSPETVRGYFEIMNVAVTEFEFRNCIVDHNLEDENGTAIDFTHPMRAWRLDPKIGAEIARAIDSLNQEDEDDLAPLPIALSSSSLGETTE